jgi:hypothetical protein
MFDYETDNRKDTNTYTNVNIVCYMSCINVNIVCYMSCVNVLHSVLLYCICNIQLKNKIMVVRGEDNFPQHVLLTSAC